MLQKQTVDLPRFRGQGFTMIFSVYILFLSPLIYWIYWSNRQIYMIIPAPHLRLVTYFKICIKNTMNHLQSIKTTQTKQTATELWEQNQCRTFTPVICLRMGTQRDFNFLLCTCMLPTDSTVS